MVRAVSIGWLTRDDIVLADGMTHMGTAGGGALYSAVGAAIWIDGVALHAVAGMETIETTREAVAAYGLDTRGIEPAPGRGIELWLLHESDVHKQQLPKVGSAVPAALDARRGPVPEALRSAAGYHIAPQTPAGTLAAIAAVRDLPQRPLVTVDILADAFVDAAPYRDLSFLRGVSAFLPSETEIARIWSPPDIEAWVVEQAKRLDCHVGAKLGARGAIIAVRGGKRLLHIPAYPADVLDTTGAGDAFCGGFLAGLIGGADLETAAAMATVSASLVVEACGALATARPSPAERQRRLDRIRDASNVDVLSADLRET